MLSRNWVTPFTIGSFLLVGITGLLMLLKIRSGLIQVAHEWLSLLFVVGSILHIVVNWRAVKGALARTNGRLIIGAFVLLLAAAVVPWNVRGVGGHVNPDRQATALLLQAPIGTLAQLTGRTPEELTAALGRQGVRISSPQITLAAAARASRIHPAEALATVLAGVAGEPRQPGAQGR